MDPVALLAAEEVQSERLDVSNVSTWAPIMALAVLADCLARKQAQNETDAVRGAMVQMNYSDADRPLRHRLYLRVSLGYPLLKHSTIHSGDERLHECSLVTLRTKCEQNLHHLQARILE